MMMDDNAQPMGTEGDEETTPAPAPAPEETTGDEGEAAA